VQTVCDSDTIESLLLGMFESIEPSVINNIEESVHREESIAFIASILKGITNEAVDSSLNVLKLLLEHGLADFLEEYHRLQYPDMESYPKSLLDVIESIIASNDRNMSSLQTVQVCALICDRTFDLGLFEHG
jgi:hypothetical protein